MAQPLKEAYSEAFYNSFLDALTKNTKVDRALFLKAIFDKQWGQLELKDRMRHTSNVLRKMLPGDALKQAESLVATIPIIQKSPYEDQGFEYMFLPDFIEQTLLNQPKYAIPMLKELTRFITCEFAIRPFIIQDEKGVMKQMLDWSKDENEHVRRLSSEGCRPRLPWAMALPAFKKDPGLILLILENLKNDPSEYVRRSVANNLNDISKDHPQIMIDYLKKWDGISEHTNRLLKHAARTLLKAGDKEVMNHYGLTDKGLKVEKYKLQDHKVAEGERLHFDLCIMNELKSAKKYRLEYAMSFKLKNGKYGRKVFKISEGDLEPQAQIQISKYHDFKNISTRTYYPGIHKIALVVNGIEKDELEFELLK